MEIIRESLKIQNGNEFKERLLETLNIKSKIN